MQFSYNQVRIESLGYTLPETTVSSGGIEQHLEPLYQRLKLPAGRLELMTGIANRRFWPAGTAISDISRSSCQLALQAAGVDPSRVGLLVHGSVCRDHLEPATACRVHRGCGLPDACQIYDVSNACLGILNGMIQAANMIELGQIEYALVVGSENGRGLVDATIQELNQNRNLNRKTIKNSIASLTIGSASCAVLLSGRGGAGGARLVGGAAAANTRYNDLCRSLGDRAGGEMQPLMETDSEALMLQGIETGRQTFQRFLEQTGWHRSAVGQTICHQVGSAHRKLMLEAIGMDSGRDFVTYPDLGNTGSAALPVTLARAVEANHLVADDAVGLLGIGSGINCLMLGLEYAPIACRGRETDCFESLEPATG